LYLLKGYTTQKLSKEFRSKRFNSRSLQKKNFRKRLNFTRTGRDTACIFGC